MVAKLQVVLTRRMPSANPIMGQLMMGEDVLVMTVGDNEEAIIKELHEAFELQTSIVGPEGRKVIEVEW